MQRLNSLRRFCRQNAIFLITVPVVIIADQLTKLWIRSSLALGESVFNLGFFRISHIQNTGASFGMFKDKFMMLSIISIIGVCAVLFLIFFMRRRLPFLNSKPVLFSLGLILGGNIGNLIDRLSRQSVTDFIDFSFFPAFNVADSSLVVGAILLAFLIILYDRQNGQPDARKD